MPTDGSTERSHSRTPAGTEAASARPPTITLIVPALNEEALITETVHQILEKVEGRFSDYEVLLINDGSTDATGALMDQLAASHPHVSVIHHDTNVGLGAAYREGCARARFEYVMLLCGDGGMPAASLPAIFDRIGAADIVIPYCRNLRQIKSPSRYLLSRTYTQLLNLLFGLRLRYYNGLPVHRTELVRAAASESDGFGFQGEILVKLLKAGHTYVEVAVDGAEKANRSSALRLKNVVSVLRTLGGLVRHVSSSRSRVPIQTFPVVRSDGFESDRPASR